MILLCCSLRLCKFRKEYSKQYVENECEIRNCDQKCLNRHTKPCQNKKTCKFYKKNVCAFKHNTLEKENESEEKDTIILDEIGKLKNNIGNEKVEMKQKLKA